MSQSPFTLTRQEAADQLGISLRTLDRYLKRGKLDYVRTGDNGRQVRVNRLSVLDFLDQQESPAPSPKTTHHSPTPVDKSLDSRQDKTTTSSTDNNSSQSEQSSSEIYQKLYEDTRQKLDEANRRLEGANYRVGELEARLKNTVPLLEHQATTEKVSNLENKVQKLHHEVTEGAMTNYRLTTQINHAKNTADLERQKRYFYTGLLALFILLSSLIFSLLS